MDLTIVEDRLLTIETAIAHLQHDHEQFHATLLGLQKEMRELRQTLMRLEYRIAQAQDATHEAASDEAD